MSRIHIGLEVADVEKSTQFYTELFGAEPTLHKSDYAKWMLENPKVNFSISSFCGAKPGMFTSGCKWTTIQNSTSSQKDSATPV